MRKMGKGKMVIRSFIGATCTRLEMNKLFCCFMFSFLVVIISLLSACSSGGGDSGSDPGDTITVPIAVSIQAVPGDGQNTVTSIASQCAFRWAKGDIR